jgi:hypothetical protein
VQEAAPFHRVLSLTTEVSSKTGLHGVPFDWHAGAWMFSTEKTQRPDIILTGSKSRGCEVDHSTGVHLSITPSYCANIRFCGQIAPSSRGPECPMHQRSQSSPAAP